MECINQRRSWPFVYFFEDNVSKQKRSELETGNRLKRRLFSQGRTQNHVSAKGDDVFPLLWVQSGEAAKDFGDSSHEDVFTSNGSGVYR